MSSEAEKVDMLKRDFGISNGFLSPNDIHRLENMDLIPADQGGDDYYLNGGYVKLKISRLNQVQDQ